MNIEILVKRSRIPIVLFAGILIMAVFLFLIIHDDGAMPFFYYMPLYIVLLGYGVLLTVFSFLDYMKTLFDKNAKLILSETGLDDNLSILSCGPIPWSGISGISLLKIKRFNSYYIVVKLFENNKYLKKKNFLIRYILKKYIKIYGGMVVISEKRIAYNIQKLKQEIMERGIPNV